MIDFWASLIKGLTFFKSGDNIRKEEKRDEPRQDTMDYDGMGNYGRFTSKMKKNRDD